MLLFRKTKELEQKVDSFLDILSQASLVFKKGVEDYLNKNKDDFSRHLQELRTLESQADSFRREIELHLYAHTLIPESRGDVLALLETTDRVLDQAQDALMDFSIEHPEIPEVLNEDFLLLTHHATDAVEAMVQTTRAFFRDNNAVRDHLHKIHFYEKEADQVSERLKRRIFEEELGLGLAEKIHLRCFARSIDTVADYAEDVADRLAIYTIKRSI